MYLINSFSISRLNNAEITGFLINVQKQISKSTANAIGIDTELNTAYNDALRLLVDQVYTTQGSLHTTAMQEADKKRDVIYKRIRLKLQAVEVAEEGSQLQKIADKVQTFFLSRYGSGVVQKPYQEETAILQGFLFDLHDKLDDDDVELLNIEGDITRLEQANNAFIEAYQLRAAEKAEGDVARTQKLRNELCDYFAQICIILQFYANSSDDKAAACQDFIKHLNVILADAKYRLDHRSGKGGEGGQDGNEGGQGDTEGGNEQGDNGGGSGEGSGEGDGGNTTVKPDGAGSGGASTGGSTNTGGTPNPGNGNVTDF